MSASLFNGSVADDYPDYLRDESRRTGHADTISFAKTEEEIREVLAAGHIVTPQGSRTGITAGAVPLGGHVLNLSRMNRILRTRFDATRDEAFVTIQPGVTLSELRSCLHDCELRANYFPPDPTETSASLGGMVACNASGACSYRYGATRGYVEAMRVVLYGGDVLVLRRGREKAKGRCFSVVTEGGRVIEGRLPAYTLPAVKNVAGYFVQDDMDLLDVFIGSDGTLGVFSELELRVVHRPPSVCGVMAFFPSEDAALAFVHAIRAKSDGSTLVAVEYFDQGSLDLLRSRKVHPPDIPEIPDAFGVAIYLEYHGTVERVAQAVEAVPGLMSASGGDEAASWVAESAAELERFKRLRHAVPESVNRLIEERRQNHPGLTKLGTDMAVPDAELAAVMAMYRKGLAEAHLQHVIFGHIGNNHLHVNILPETPAEYGRGQDLYLQWARRVVALGGTVAAEHGIGKLKVALLREMMGEEAVRQMRALKRLFDPDSRLNPGNLF